MKKKIIIIAVIVLIVVSLGFNVYILLWKNTEQRILQKGANIIVNQIINQINQTGEVQIGDMILIQKKELPTGQSNEGGK